MKKDYIAPLAEEIRFFACDVLAPSFVLGEGELGDGSKDDFVTDVLPIDIF